VTVKVIAWYTNSIPVLYMVVDLSEGTEAERYPVTHSFSAPDLSDPSCVSNKLWLRYVPSGTFNMGSPDEEAGRDLTSYNAIREVQHQVTLTRGFFAGVCETTRAQYRLVLGDENDPSGGISWLRPVNNVNMEMLWGEGFNPAKSNETASTSFFGVLRAKTGLEFTLPTDAQWEYACRAGTTTPYNIATNDTVSLGDFAFYSANASSAGIQVVGTQLPNAWGLYDMHGNVNEYCRDLMSVNLPDSVDPLYGTYNSGTPGYLMRGGSIKEDAARCRSAYRAWRAGDNTADIGSNGFRLWLTLDK